ncbi:MAG: chlorite dismutase family protein [Microthrixaceae bacterium]|nr:chlorite dismutase family protein [Microthrixaceae bacterium]
MVEGVSPSIGLGVLHLFFHVGPDVQGEAVLGAIKDAQAEQVQVVTAAILGHKADLAVMALADEQWKLRRLQSALVAAGLTLSESYVSLTELSEYAQGVPEAMRQARLYPQLPIPDKPVFCFYPMSKARNVGANWYELDYERRKELMYEHGASGRKFAGRVIQLITGSTGLDEYEWGVTLFADVPDTIKEIVYTMRYDVASAQYGVFGPFYFGMVDAPEQVLSELGV